MIENQQGTDASLKGLGSSDSWIFHFGKDGSSGPSKYRHTISRPTLETRLRFTAKRKTLAKPSASGEVGLEIRMQSVEITWAPKTDLQE
jgi:hypothetical protein